MRLTSGAVAPGVVVREVLFKVRGAVEDGGGDEGRRGVFGGRGRDQSRTGEERDECSHIGRLRSWAGDCR